MSAFSVMRHKFDVQRSGSIVCAESACSDVGGEIIASPDGLTVERLSTAVTYHVESAHKRPERLDRRPAAPRPSERL